MSLPSGYTKLEYIQSSGEQYINTKFKPNGNTRVVTTIEGSLATTGAWFFGTRTANGVKSYSFLTYKGAYRSDYGSKTGALSAYNPIGKIVIDKNKNSTSVNGIVIDTLNSQSFQCDYNLYLFCNNNGGSAASFFGFSMYSCKIYDNNVLIRDYVPCKDNIGTIGLYDAVNNQFYANSGTGTFIGGPESGVGGIYVKVNGIWKKVNNVSVNVR